MQTLPCGLLDILLQITQLQLTCWSIRFSLTSFESLKNWKQRFKTENMIKREDEIILKLSILKSHVSLSSLCISITHEILAIRAWRLNYKT